MPLVQQGPATHDCTFAACPSAALRFAQLQAMQAVDVPVYDFTSHQRSETETRRVEPADVIVIEGILVLHIPDVCQRLHMKVYVDTDDDVRLARRYAVPSGVLPSSFARWSSGM